MAKNKKNKKNRGEDEEHDNDGGDVESLLESLDEEGWGDTEELSFDIKRGKYQLHVDSCTLVKAKKSGLPQFKVEMTVVGPEAKGRKVWKYLGIGDEVQRGYTRGALAKLGIDWPKKAKQLVGILEDDLVDTYVEANLSPQSDGQGINCYFTRALDDDEVDDDEDEKPKKKKKAKAEDDEDGDDADSDGDSDAGEDEDDADSDDAKPKKKKGKAKDEDEDEEEEEEEDDTDDDEDEEEEEEKPKGKKKSGGKSSKADEDEDTVVNLNFDESDLEDDHKVTIKKLAKKLKYDTKRYDSLADLAGDMAEQKGRIEGTFSKPGKFLKALKEALEEKDLI